MKEVIEFKGNNYSDLYEFDGKTNERVFIKTVNKMSGDVITSEELSSVRQLGYDDNVTYCRVFNWFRKRWGYTSWIEKTGKEYNYKIYARGVYHSPMHSPDESPYCKSYEEAQTKLLNQLVTIVEEIEK